MENFEKINDLTQERLRELLAHQEVLVALLVAMIETHPRPEALREQFAFHFETLNSRWLNSQLKEDFLDAGAAVQQALDGAFDRPRR